MLWNLSAIEGYAITASDGRLGSVSDFLAHEIDWMDQLVKLTIDRQKVKDSPAYDAP